jgi:hypothetical protein
VVTMGGEQRGADSSVDDGPTSRTWSCPCHPSPKVSVSTWIDRVDLALEGSRSSGRGNWSDSELYFILGNKLMDSASRWWVTTNRKVNASRAYLDDVEDGAVTAIRRTP